MNDTTDSGEPSYTADTGKPPGGDDYIFVFGLFSMVLLLVALIYAYKRSRSPTISFGTTDNNDARNHHIVRFSRGLDDDVLVTFPTFLYSDAMTTHKGGPVTDVKATGCSICLADYKPVDVVRVLPECGHLFHIKCIDTWLKAHPTCPVCRKSVLTG